MTMNVLTKCVCYLACSETWDYEEKQELIGPIWVSLSFLLLISFRDKYPHLSSPALLQYLFCALFASSVERRFKLSLCAFLSTSLCCQSWTEICAAILPSIFPNLRLRVSMIFPAALRPAHVAWQWQLEWYVSYSAVICIMGTVEGSAQCQCFWCSWDKTVVSCRRLTDLELYQQLWINSVCLFC